MTTTKRSELSLEHEASIEAAIEKTMFVHEKADEYQG